MFYPHFADTLFVCWNAKIEVALHAWSIVRCSWQNLLSKTKNINPHWSTYFLSPNFNFCWWSILWRQMIAWVQRHNFSWCEWSLTIESIEKNDCLSHNFYSYRWSIDCFSGTSYFLSPNFNFCGWLILMRQIIF